MCAPLTSPNGERLRTMSFMKMTVSEASSKLLVGVEIGCWFFAGEMVGRGSIIGYDV